MISFLVLTSIMFAAVYLLVGWAVAYDEPPGRRILYALFWMSLPWIETNLPRILKFFDNSPHETKIDA